MAASQNNLILVNIENGDTKVAVIEDNVLEEFYIETQGSEGIVGNIYKGRVSSILPGMNAAFVDIGEGKNGFLYVEEIRSGPIEMEEAKEAGLPAVSGRKRGRKIDLLLKKGQELLVQVEKEAYGTKGPRITTEISIPGRKLVFMPHNEQKGISRRIEDAIERERLRSILAQIKLPQGTGIIVRTQGAGYSRRDFEYELRYLIDVWRGVVNKTKKAACPSLIHKESGLIMRIARDIFGEDTAKLVVNSKEEFKHLSHFVRSVQPNLRRKIELYRANLPIFEKFGIEREIEKIYDRKIHLKSGGYITVEQTEGLVAIDVNTGKFTGRRTLEETVTKTNMEAAREIARQLRLRDLSGIIVIDFIDMEYPKNRREVEDELENTLKRDRAKTEVFAMSPLCLVEMTRQRVRRGIEIVHQEACPYCGGRGTIKSKDSLCAQANRKLKRYLMEHGRQDLELAVPLPVANYLLNERRDMLATFERENKVKVLVLQDEHLPIEQMRIRPLR